MEIDIGRDKHLERERERNLLGEAIKREIQRERDYRERERGREKPLNCQLTAEEDWLAVSGRQKPAKPSSYFLFQNLSESSGRRFCLWQSTGEQCFLLPTVPERGVSVSAAASASSSSSSSSNCLGSNGSKKLEPWAGVALPNS
jgi:hypothetical protein